MYKREEKDIHVGTYVKRAKNVQKTQKRTTFFKNNQNNHFLSQHYSKNNLFALCFWYVLVRFFARFCYVFVTFFIKNIF